ncbi:hypothetical protein L218DRAFT_138571 [Marasmius fiardii PR-910]|nr:hypothetical protein L218DRAFT_138571 [Marasmius fiardii PR-910]
MDRLPRYVLPAIIFNTLRNNRSQIVSPLPSLSSPSDSNSTNINRTAVIAGSTVAGVVIILLILAAVFISKRHQNRRTSFIRSLIQRAREGRGAGSVGLLDDEFDDDGDVPMTRYRDDVASHTRSASRPTPGHTPTPSISGSARGPTPLPTTPLNPHSSPIFGLPSGAAAPVVSAPPAATGLGAIGALANTSTTSVDTKATTPSLFRPRASESGSIFREELTENTRQSSKFVDPLLTRSGEIDFSSIVDDVMGPSPTSPNSSGSAGPTATTAALVSANTGKQHEHPPGATPPTHVSMPSTSSSIYDPFSANTSSSFYSSHAKDVSIRSTISMDSTGPTSLLGLPAGTSPVKKSSPLAISVTSPSSTLKHVPPATVSGVGKSPSSPPSSFAPPPPPIPARSPMRTPSPKRSSIGTPPAGFAPPPPKTLNWIERSPKRSSHISLARTSSEEGESRGGVGQAL